MTARSEASKPLIFGTDGVRDRARAGLLEAASVERIVRATARVLMEPGRFAGDFPGGRGSAIAVARDTRESGEELYGVISGAFAAWGYDVANLGILPTPGAAWLSAAWPEIALGVVISASHNP